MHEARPQNLTTADTRADQKYITATLHGDGDGAVEIVVAGKVAERDDVDFWICDELEFGRRPNLRGETKGLVAITADASAHFISAGCRKCGPELQRPERSGLVEDVFGEPWVVGSARK